MKNYYRQSLTLSVFLILLNTINSPIFSQNSPSKTITGIITESDSPLDGVNILVKNTLRGSITDLDGNYSITAAATDTLVYTFVGFKTQEIAVGNNASINVTMQPDATTLDQIIINAGYYNVTDKEKTGSISQLNAKEIETQPVSNPLSTMQGRMAGVNIIQTTGVPGGGFSVRIRGRNSIRIDGSEPLYVVDGVPYASQSLGSSMVSTVLGGTQSPLNGISPNDIESIEVLKDADATSIYGSRGANGVVLITTKKGKPGKTSFQINTGTGVGTITRKMELLNTEQYLAMRREAFTNDGITNYPFNAYDLNGTWSQNRETDWQEELIGGTAYNTNASASVQGGNDNTSFLLRGGYEEQTTVFPGDYKYKKGSTLVNLSHKTPDNSFRIQFNGNYVADNNNQPTTNLTREAMTLVPNAPALYDSEGNLNWENGTFNNPLAALEGEYISNTNTILANSIVSYTPYKGLEVKANLGYTKFQLEETRTAPHTIYNPAFGLDSSYSSSTFNNGERNSWLVEPQISYTYALGKGKIEALVGGTIQKEKTTSLLQVASNFPTNSLIYNPAAAANLFISNNSDEVYNYRALFGRLNFNWEHKYIVNATARRDGSSRFGPGNQYANFGALGVAWVFSEETFVTKALPFLSFGKLRASYGTTGNDQIGNYGYLNTYTTEGLSYQGIQTLSPIQLFNPDYGWETNKKLETAIEVGFMEDKITLSASWYRNRSSNQLVGVPLPGTTGFSSLQANLDATVENRGWEVEIETVNIQSKKLQWRTFLNLTIPKNELISFPGLSASTYANQYVVGEPLNIVLLYNATGVNPQTGTYTFEDIDGDGIISKPNDLKSSANLDPKYYGGFRNALSYGNFNLDFLFQFVKQQGRNYHTTIALPGTMGNQPVQVLEHWQQPGDTASQQLFSTGSNNDAYAGYLNNYDSTSSISDASFIRLKNIAASYTIPSLLSSPFGCQISVEAQNLLTITKYEGPDPETQIYGNLPPLKQINLGVQLTF
ncbi:SusC/RagA family TonB-linked outer membrane protein [Ulvibacter litoralis]|uniref:TonB-linked outer membrane protein, SusC/RagA family n=1 Tax=Ulvibacter litoralis TaxID=227084 RepID=A0A1G7JES9_9FLAO|nr:SusC/RagA family TonB-linked outer membrane protein [Ulvibacter litoralis]GHC64951.1 SusC/RagA family TonB-linked outer membrane protein [Ulvibacter litoralis]SDF23426.1 TonB-linked outer membrane protein, SusC/RagA family [Ulvibacter litoralis]